MRREAASVKSWVDLDAQYRSVKDLPSGSPRMLLVHGRPGLGKTTAVDWFSNKHRGVYLVASSTWNQRDLLSKLAERIGAAPRPKDRAPRVLEMILTELDKSRCELLVIDEFDRVTHKTPIVELVREIYDASDVPVALVGMGAIEASLKQFPQFDDRIGARVAFRPVDFEDAAKVARQLCEVKLSDDLIAHAHRKTGGVLRLLVTEIAGIERMAKREGLAEVGLADLDEGE